MHQVELVLGLLAIAVLLAIAARKTSIPAPIFLIIGGLLIGLQPIIPTVPLDPKIVFLLFIPPLLYASAFQTDWNEFYRYIRPISLLSIGLVILTSIVVALVANWMIGLPWQFGLVLGAIVSPPDAVAAVAITKPLKVQRRVVAILEGESLVNDASALVLYRLAMAAVVSGTFSITQASLQFVYVSIGGIVFGIIVGWLATKLHPFLEKRNLTDSKLSITITLLTPFAAYLPAEACHLSGVLSVVTAGLWVGNQCEKVFSKELYQEAKAVWEWIDFLLNSLIFILIGFQLRNVLDGLRTDYSLSQLFYYAAGISLAVILTRLIWVFPAAYLPRWFSKRIRRNEPSINWQGVFIVGWTGLRGVVSLAAALAIPNKLEDKTAFPHRDLILFLTFWVIFVTLVGQGLTLPWIIKWLGVEKLDMPTPQSQASDEKLSL